jgi:hypothetical protein
MSGNASVVATDSGFLAFWKTGTLQGSGFIQVARFSPDGTLERRSMAAGVPSSFTWYDAGSSGDQVLLAGWCEGRWDGTLCLARFSAAGDFLGLTRTPFARPSAPVVASNGEGFLVVFAAPVPGWTVLALPVSPEGTERGAFPLGPWDQFSHWPSAAAIEGTYYVAFGTTGARVLVRLGEDGVDSSVNLVPPAAFGQVRIEGSGDRLLVVTAPTTGMNPGLQAAVFDGELARRTDWLLLPGGNSMARITPTASGWIVAAEGGMGGAGATMLPVTRAGVPGEPTLVPGPRGFVIDAAGRGDRAALLWPTEADYTLPDFPHNAMKLAVFDSGASPVSESATISLGPAPQVHPAAEYGSGVTLAAWVEVSPDGRFVVNARPFDEAGAPVAPPVAMPFRGSAQSSPAVAFDGASFLVVWSEGVGGLEGVFGARVAPDGRLLDAEAIPLFGPAPLYSGRVRSAAVDWSGTSWIVASSDERWMVVARRVSPGGAVLDAAPVAISPPPEYGAATDFAPILECNGAECLVAWCGPPFATGSCQITCPTPPPSIRAAIVGPDLTVLHRVPVPLTREWEDPGVRSLSASWNGIANAWRVSWSLDGTRRIARDGALLDEADYSYGGSTSAIPERDGWRIVWSPRTRLDLFQGWSATGKIKNALGRSALTATSDSEWDPRAVHAPRPLAFFQRESQLSAGSPEVLGRFLDEASDPLATNLVLTAARAGRSAIAVSWTTDLEDATGFTIAALYGSEWRGVGSVAPAARTFEFMPHSGVTHVKITASSPSGAIESNVVEVPGQRQRTVTRVN